jgi:hypothetical protein
MMMTMTMMMMMDDDDRVVGFDGYNVTQCW